MLCLSSVHNLSFVPLSVAVASAIFCESSWKVLVLLLDFVGDL